jgi:hypothetical protein
MKNDTFVFTIRCHLLGELLAQIEKLGFDHALLGFQSCMIDPWPAAPVMAWSLAVYSDSEDKAPRFVESIPIIRVVGGGDHERAGVLSYRYGVLDSLRALWEQCDSAVVLLDLTVRVRDDVRENTLEPVRLEPSAMIRCFL